MAAFKTVRNYVFTLGIALLFLFFVIYLVEAISPTPKYEDYCASYGPYTKPMGIERPITVEEENTRFRETELTRTRTENECMQQGGTLVNYTYEEGTNYFMGADCSFCNKEFEADLKEHSLIVFYVTTIAGVLALLAGLYVFTRSEAISLGFMFGGLILIFYGGIQSFQYFGRIARVVLLGLGLLLLIWIAYKKLQKD